MEKEFLIHDKMKVLINRNDFDDLGSILEIIIQPLENLNLNLFVTNFISISFYDYNSMQLPKNQLILLTNQESIFFDNVLILSNLNNQTILLKLLNKEIYFIKIHVSTTYVNLKKINKDSIYNCFNSTRIFDVYHLEELDLNLLADLKQKNNQLCNNIEETSIDKNEHINLIFQELNQVNLSLINEKEKMEKTKSMIKTKEDQINSMIVSFKKEIMIYSDKFFNESYSKFNLKIIEIQKKLQITENNVLNKYKIIKDKINEKSNTSMIKNTKINSFNNDINSKEKFANLEIKIKFLDDTINHLKSKLNEKEEVIKTYLENEDKLLKLNKKHKDEIISLQNKIKSFEEKIEIKKDKTNINIIVNNTESKINTNVKENPNTINKKKQIIKKSLKNKFEFTKEMINDYNEYFILEYLLLYNKDNKVIYMPNLNDKEVIMCTNILLQISNNPINLFQKFPFSFVFIIRKISDNFSTNSKDKNIIKDKIIEAINNYPDIKKQLLNSESFNVDNLSKNTKNNIVNPFLDLDIILNEKEEIKLNEILLSKINFFSNYLLKNEKKYLEKNNYAQYKILSLSIIIYKIVLLKNFEEIFSVLKNVLHTIIYTKDYFGINYLIFSLNYFDLFIQLLNTQNNYSGKNLNEMFQLFIDSFLFLYSLDERYNIFENNNNIINFLLEQTSILNYLKSEINKLNSKVIIFTGIISEYATKEIKLLINFENIKDKVNDEIIMRNLKRLI